MAGKSSGNAIKQHVLVIGYPEFIALRMVDELLERWRGTTVCLLVLPDSSPRVKKTLAARYTPAKLRRIRLFEGMVNALDMGLSGEEYNELAKKVRYLFNLSTCTYTGLSRRDYLRLNVEGVSRIVDFARDCENLRRFAHFSSLYVSGRRKGVIRENELGREQSFRNHMELTCFRGETLVNRAMADVPVTVFRMGPLLGDSQTGEVTSFEGPLKLMLTILLADRNKPIFLPGNCHGITNFTPSDYVVKAALHLITQEDALGRIYHLSDPYPLTFKTFFEVLCTYLGRSMPSFGVPQSMYKGILHIPMIENILSFPKQVYEYFNHRAVHNCAATLEALKDTDIRCPAFESYFPLEVEFTKNLLRSRQESREERETVDPFDRI